MALCSNSCAPDAPYWSADACNITTTEGGIDYLIFATCNFRFNTTITKADGSTVAIGPITDPESWREAVHNRFISRSPQGYGEKTSSTFTSERVVACSPEVIASKTHVLNFISKDTDPTNFTDVDYWDDVENNYLRYRLMFMGCDDVVYYTGDADDPGFEWVPTASGFVIPNNNDENAYYEFNVNWKYKGIVPRIEVIGIDNAFTEDIVGT